MLGTIGAGVGGTVGDVDTDGATGGMGVVGAGGIGTGGAEEVGAGTVGDRGGVTAGAGLAGATGAAAF